MKRKFLKWAVVPLIAIVAFVGLSSFVEPNETEGGGGNCDLCILKNHKKDLNTGGYR